MTVDAILAAVAELPAAERDELLARLRDEYGEPRPPDPAAGPRPDQTGVYSIEQLIDRARRSG
jgi:hypothetical protein